MRKQKTLRFLFGLASFVVSVSLAIPSVSAAPTPSASAAAPTDAQIVHLLNRIAFGPAPGDVETVRRMGVDTYIQMQLHPASLSTSADLDNRLRQLTTLDASSQQLVSDYFIRPADKKEMSEEDKKEANKREAFVGNELSEAKIIRAIESPAQLEEVMTDFWYNHFNVFIGKELDKILVTSYERDAIRPYALGRFRDLLQATAHHPAMLYYLDNWLNTDPNSVAARGKKIGLNENYAREVMELHTLGVDGGYTQGDVTTLAQILTGFGVGEGKDPALRASFYFDPKRHDFSNKVFLNTSIRGGDEREVDAVLDMLATNPATAHHIALELAQYFVSDNPSPALVERLTETFRSSDGDIGMVLQALFRSDEFWDPKNRQVKFKTPFRYVVSTLRASNIMPPGDTKLLQGAIAQMGEPLYRCQTPNGYSFINDQWLNSDALLKRIDFSKKLSDFLPQNAAALIEASRSGDWSPNTQATVQKAEPKLQAMLLLSSPEFVYY